MNRKVINIGIIVITVILAGVAIFTAVRLYQRGQEPVAPSAPGSEPFAWDCSSYNFSLELDGTVRVDNSSSRSEPSQQAEVYINGDLVDTFEVPALAPGDSQVLGQVPVPTEEFNWQIIGTRDCQDSGTLQGAPLCQEYVFTVEQGPTSTPTPTGTAGPTATPTATSTPGPTATGTISPSPTSTPTEPPVGGGPTNTPVPTATATPTTGQIAQADTPAPTDSGDIGGTDEELPDAGFADPIYLFLLSGLLTIFAAIVLAL